MKNRAFSTVLVLIILIIVVGGGIFVWQYFGVPKEEVGVPGGGVAEDETANWQTYKSSKYNYSFHYPSSTKIVAYTEYGNETSDIENNQSFIAVKLDNKRIFSVQSGISTTPLSEEKINQQFGATPPSAVLKEVATIAGVPGYKVKITNDPILQKNKTWYFVQKNNIIFDILLLNEQTNENKRPELDQILKKILESFTLLSDEITTTPTVSCEYKKGEYEFRVYDSEGRVTGLVNGTVKQEISRSVYANGEVTIYFPQDYYEYELLCLKEGNYQLERSSVQEGEEITFKVINIPIFPGQAHRYKINWKTLAELGSGTELFIDNDGDGSFEKTIPIDGTEFTCEEFIVQTGE